MNRACIVITAIVFVVTAVVLVLDGSPALKDHFVAESAVADPVMRDEGALSFSASAQPRAGKRLFAHFCAKCHTLRRGN